VLAACCDHLMAGSLFQGKGTLLLAALVCVCNVRQVSDGTDHDCGADRQTVSALVLAAWCDHIMAGSLFGIKGNSCLLH
jgi:hypothetical protein